MYFLGCDYEPMLTQGCYDHRGGEISSQMSTHSKVVLLAMKSGKHRHKSYVAIRIEPEDRSLYTNMIAATSAKVYNNSDK